MSMSLFTSDDLDDGGIPQFSPLMVATSYKCAWSECYVAGNLMGCLILDAEPKDGCKSGRFHHCCQTGWEMARYLHDFPVGDPGQCTYESGHRTKYCMQHHTFGPLTKHPLSQEETEKIAVSEASKAMAKDNHAAKKKKSQEFIEKQTLDNIVLKSDRKDVESIGGVSWSKFRNEERFYTG